MANRRDFLKTVAGTAAGMLIANRFSKAARGAEMPQGQAAAPAATVKRREVSVGGKRVKVVDVHAHCMFPEVADIVAGTSLARNGRGGGGGAGGGANPQVLG